MTARVSSKLVSFVNQRANGRCEYCQAPQIIIGQVFHIDHITPRSSGGETTSENLCLACSHCNIAKGNRTTALDRRTQKEVPLFNPRRDSWHGHFRWNGDRTSLIGRTAVGRATVAALDMNASIIRRARLYWGMLGLMP